MFTLGVISHTDIRLHVTFTITLLLQDNDKRQLFEQLIVDNAFEEGCAQICEYIVAFRSIYLSIKQIVLNLFYSYRC